jgi:hypothetical protein
MRCRRMCFQDVKPIFTYDLILRYLYTRLPTIIEITVSEYTICTILIHVENGSLKPFDFY